MKKFLSVLLTVICFVFIFAFAACNDGGDSAGNSAGEGAGNGDGSSLGGDTKTLVVYFSAQNHTERVAGYIAKATGGDILGLMPVNAYSGADLNWTDTDSRVCREHDDVSLRDVKLIKNTVDNWDGYDTVFIGYPIWWGIAAWPVNDFIKNNDFTGKTVIPFCTSSSSPIGDSGTLLAQAAGTGNWQTGQRFQSNVTEATVVSWVNGLNLT